jgi:hypothetical protein
MSFLGADTDELREAGQKCQEGKEQTDEVIMCLRVLIMVLRACSFFSGGASAAYAEYLESTVVPWLTKISEALGLFATVLNANAEAQDRVSAGEYVDFSTLPTYRTPSNLPDRPVGQFPGTVADDAIGTVTSPRPQAGGPGGPVTPAPGTPSAIGGIETPTASPAASGTTSGELVGSIAGSTGGLGESVIGGGSGSPGSGSSGPAGTGGGGAGSPAGADGLGSSAIDGASGTEDGTITSTASPAAPTEFGGAVPGAEAGGSTDLGAIGDPIAAGDNEPSYGAAAGIAGGAAALGLGGTALANRGGRQPDPELDRLTSRNGRGSSGDEVREIQRRLTDAGFDTHGTDGKWGANTQAAYDAWRLANPLEVRQGTGYASPDGYDYNQIKGVRGNANVSPQFLREVEAVSQRLGAKPEHLMAAMSFETGGKFGADTPNAAGGSARGLIQFMPSTARGLGTTSAALAAMTPTEQLAYVENYFAPYRGRLTDLESVYTSILAGRPTSGESVLFNQGTAAYRDNAGLDLNRDGRITATEATSFVRARMGAGN